MTHLAIRIIAALFVLGGLAHWLLLFGVLHEHAPWPIAIYFHSLAVLDPLAGAGLWRCRQWGRWLALAIAATQLAAHGCMIYLDTAAGWQSGVGLPERLLDMAFALFLLVFLNLPSRRRLFR